MQIPLNEVVHFDVITSNPTSGAAVDADATPTFAVYEDATDTDIGVGGNMTKRTSLTGNYRGSFTASAANGFEVGKWYNVIASATVGGATGKTRAMLFRLMAAEATEGTVQAAISGFTPADVGAIKAKTDNLPVDPADASDIAGSFTTVNTKLDTIAAYVDTEVGAIKAKTDNLPPDPADASDIAASFVTVNSKLDTLSGYVDTEVAAIKAKTDNLPAAPAAVSDIPTANQNADALLDRAAGVETGLTPRQFLRLVASALLGKVSGAATTSIKFRDTADSKDRITATVDSSGNRTAVTLDAS